MSLNQADGGPCPPPEIMRAILHGIAAGACETAARETRSAYWAAVAVDQRTKATALLHQAACDPIAFIARSDIRRASARDERSS